MIVRRAPGIAITAQVGHGDVEGSTLRSAGDIGGHDDRGERGVIDLRHGNGRSAIVEPDRDHCSSSPRCM